jgi:hypothetical protein
MIGEGVTSLLYAAPSDQQLPVVTKLKQWRSELWRSFHDHADPRVQQEALNRCTHTN